LPTLSVRATVVCVPLTSNLVWADAPGNVLLRARATGLPKDSVANASQIVAIDRSLLTRRIGRVTGARLDLILRGIDVVLGR
jgi:mRNA interferase MazF